MYFNQLYYSWSYRLQTFCRDSLSHSVMERSSTAMCIFYVCTLCSRPGRCCCCLPLYVLDALSKEKILPPPPPSPHSPLHASNYTMIHFISHFLQTMETPHTLKITRWRFLIFLQFSRCCCWMTGVASCSHCWSHDGGGNQRVCCLCRWRSSVEVQKKTARMCLAWSRHQLSQTFLSCHWEFSGFLFEIDA